MPNIDSLFAPLPIVDLKPIEFDFDAELFRALCIRNLTGDVSYNSLKEYAVAYSLLRVTIDTIVVKH